MKVKLVYGEMHSEWIFLTAKQHKTLMDNPPDGVMIRIGDFYPDSPDKEQLEIISFPLLCCLAREFTLCNAAQLRSDSRHVHMEELEEWELVQDVEQEIIHQENNVLLRSALNQLTVKQNKRLKLYLCGLTFQEIADREQVNYNAVRESIISSLKKIKNFFE